MLVASEHSISIGSTGISSVISISASSSININSSTPVSVGTLELECLQSGPGRALFALSFGLAVVRYSCRCANEGVSPRAGTQVPWLLIESAISCSRVIEAGLLDCPSTTVPGLSSHLKTLWRSSRFACWKKKRARKSATSSRQAEKRSGESYYMTRLLEFVGRCPHRSMGGALLENSFEPSFTGIL